MRTVLLAAVAKNRSKVGGGGRRWFMVHQCSNLLKICKQSGGCYRAALFPTHTLVHHHTESTLLRIYWFAHHCSTGTTTYHHDAQCARHMVRYTTRAPPLPSSTASSFGRRSLLGGVCACSGGASEQGANEQTSCIRNNCEMVSFVWYTRTVF